MICDVLPHDSFDLATFRVINLRILKPSNFSISRDSKLLAFVKGLRDCVKSRHSLCCNGPPSIVSPCNSLITVTIKRKARADRSDWRGRSPSYRNGSSVYPRVRLTRSVSYNTPGREARTRDRDQDVRRLIQSASADASPASIDISYESFLLIQHGDS